MSGENILIRDAKHADQSNLAEMMLSLNKFEHTMSPDRNINPDAGAKHLAFTLDRIDSQGGFVLVADDNGQYAGFLIAIVSNEEGHYIDPSKREYGDIHDLFIAEPYRSKGLAKRLIAEAETRLKSLGVSRMQLYVLNDNENAIRLYKNQGFLVQELFMSKKI